MFRMFGGSNRTLIIKLFAGIIIVSVCLRYFVQYPHNISSSTSIKQTLICIQELQQRPLEEVQRDQSIMENCESLMTLTLNKDPHLDTKPLRDCYTDLEVSKMKNFPFKDVNFVRSNYLEGFSKCGHKPVQMSKNIVSVNSDNLPVPNVVHYIWFLPENTTDFSFLQYMSLFSVNKYVKPQYVLWHGNAVPRGHWWQKAVAEFPNIYFVDWDPPQQIFDRNLTRVFFASDVVRLFIEIVHGGIYLDTDTLVLKPLNSLRQHKLVMGRELKFTLSNGVILAAPWSMFLRMMLDFYHTFDGKVWAKTTMLEPNRLNTLYPDLVHIEENTLSYPSWPHVDKLYTGSFDWSNNYCIHILGEDRYEKILPKDVAQLDSANFTLGAIMRHIYYGNTKLRT